VVVLIGRARSYAAVPFYKLVLPHHPASTVTTQVATVGTHQTAPLARKDRGALSIPMSRRDCRGNSSPSRPRSRFKIGQVVTVFYNRDQSIGAPPTDRGRRPIMWRPLDGGSVFPEGSTVFCFHRADQWAPGEKREMPVVFYVDPALIKDSGQ